MDHQQFMRSCCSCGVPRMHVRSRTDHVLHLLLTVSTAGIWIPVWVLFGLFQAMPQCMTCGERPGLFGIGGKAGGPVAPCNQVSPVILSKLP